MAEDNSTINLKVLSPSTEVEGGVNFADIPATTTIQELRSRIQDAVPSKPAPERMRLIYRGRVVANDADTLGNVFGADNIRESKEQSLHLVLRELPPGSAASSSPAPRSLTAPPNPFRPPQAPTPASPPLQTNPFRAIAQPRPSSQPQGPPPHHHHHHHHHHPPGPPGHFQIPLPPAMQQQLAHTMNMAQNGQLHPGQALNAPGQPPREGTPAPENGAPAPPMGLPSLPGFGPPPNLPPNGQAVRQESIGPNGERWTVTYSSSNMPIGGQPPNPPRQFQRPPSLDQPMRAGVAPAPDFALRLRHILHNARQEMDNITMLVQGPDSSAGLPSWRIERIRRHMQTMDQAMTLVDNGLRVLTAQPPFSDNAEVVLLRLEAQILRERLVEMNAIIDQQTTQPPAQASTAQIAPSAQSAPTSNTPTMSVPSPPQAHAASPTLPPGIPEELFILSSPQGPVGVLFEQRGTFATTPLVPTLPFQIFTSQFAQNRQLIAGMGQQIAHGSGHLHNQLANIQPTPTQQPPVPGQVQVVNQPQGLGAQANQQAQAHQQAQAQVQIPNPPANPQADNDRIGNIGQHLWTLLKIACFVYFFSGGGGWYKSLVLGLVAGGVYLVQLGMFEEHFAVIRQFFEGILPIGAFADRAAQPRNQNQNHDHQQGRNVTPEEAARRLLQQRRDERYGWVRENVRSVERAVSLFVASLWPGIGERMVHAQEERARLERVAEQERLERVEEERRVQAEAEAAEKKDEPAVEGETEVGSSAKGKERAGDVVEGEASTAEVGASS